MAQVKIDSGLRYTSEVNGTFPLIAGFKKDSASKREGFIWVEAGFNGNPAKKTRLAVNEKDVHVIGVATVSKDLSDSEISSDIKDRFEVLGMLVDGVIARNIKGLIVSGAAGIGKTHTVDTKLEKALESGKVSKFSMLGGSCTAIGLFMQLWNHQNEGNVLVLDDIDAIFDDQEALNLLKRALDTGRTRQISWLGASKVLEKEGIDDTFEFHGTVIFITNHNFDERIAKGTKLAPHYEALISRCMYLDLGIHSMREVLIRIRQVLDGTDMLKRLNVSRHEKDTMMDWMMENINDLRKVDLRTVIKLAGAMKTTPKHWEKVARAALCVRG